jgi:hypothetical protein
VNDGSSEADPEAQVSSGIRGRGVGRCVRTTATIQIVMTVLPPC